MWLVLSIIFSVVALILPIARFFKAGKYLHLYSFISLSLALLCQIFYVNSLVRKEDFVALLDTTPTLTEISSVLLILALLINITGLIKNNKS